MDAPVPLIVVALLAAVALVAPGERLRAWAMLAALALAPVILVADIADIEQFASLRDRPALAAALGGGGVVVVAALALLFARHAGALPIAAVATIPFRVPIAAGDTTANLLVPLYAVVAAGVLAYAIGAIAGRAGERDGPRRSGALEWALAVAIVLYAVQATYSEDFERALGNVVFFYVPFALLFALMSRVPWTGRLVRTGLGVATGLAVALAAVGFVEYATRHLFLNPKVIASNQLEDYFRVNSLFFDPNIFGRFLVVVMLLVAAWLLWARSRRAGSSAIVILAVLWAGLVITLSQSSFASLLVGLAVLGGLRWRTRWALAGVLGAVVVGAAFVTVAPEAVRVDLGDSRSADAATSGRYDLVAGGVRLFADRPLEGQGSGSFAREYRRAEDVSAERATSASHTTPVTVAAEQGALGLAAYLALIALALGRVFRGARSGPMRAAIAAAFTALVAHTIMYAAFLEDPLSWSLLGAATAFAVAPTKAQPAPPAGAANARAGARA